MVAAVPSLRGDERNLSRVMIPDEKEAAIKTLKDWLDARGIECQTQKGGIVMNKAGLVLNIFPIVLKGQLDRLRVAALYGPKEEFKGTREYEQLVLKLNRVQNFLQVWISDEGTLGVASNLTFYDELRAREFDAFIDLYIQVVKQFILTDETLKMVK
jgi:hypothetical protein